MKKSFPKVKFIISKDIDTQYALRFAKNPRERSGSFRNMFFPKHLHFIFNNTFTEKERDKILKNYISSFYDLNKKETTRQFSLAKSGWTKKEKRFFALANKIFKKHLWPKGDYTGYATMFSCYPRFLKNKTFLFPINYPKQGAAEKVTAHELLHFIFFDYILQKYKLKDDSKIQGKEDDYIWKVSEAFNSVLEGWEPYQKIFNSISRPYPETIQVYKKMKKVWEKTEDIDKTLLSVLPESMQKTMPLKKQKTLTLKK